MDIQLLDLNRPSQAASQEVDVEDSDEQVTTRSFERRKAIPGILGLEALAGGNPMRSEDD